MAEEKVKVLCIDDDEDVLLSLQLVLQKNGYTFLGARSAEEGLKVFRQEKPDLVLVDLMMEEIDSGTAFVREVRRLGGQAPLYILSSVGDQLTLSTEWTSLGGDGVLQKPLDPKTLLATIAMRLPQHRS